MIYNKAAATVLAAISLVLAVIFFVVPGPSIIFTVIALTLLAIHYPKAQGYLKKAQLALKLSCEKLDKAFAKK